MYTYVQKLIFRTLEDDEKLLRVVSCWKPQTSNRLIFSQRPEKYDLFRRPERYLLDPYDKATTEAVMQTPWDPIERQSLLQRCIGRSSNHKNTSFFSFTDPSSFLLYLFRFGKWSIIHSTGRTFMVKGRREKIMEKVSFHPKRWKPISNN